MTTLTLLPAYGRDYKSSKEVLADWDANKDFQLALSGQYINKEQVPELIKGKITTLSFRYKRHRTQYLLSII